MYAPSLTPTCALQETNNPALKSVSVFSPGPPLISSKQRRVATIADTSLARRVTATLPTRYRNCQIVANQGVLGRRIACYASHETTLSGDNLVGLGRLELPTSPLSGVRSNQLSYRPSTLLPIFGAAKAASAYMRPLTLAILARPSRLRPTTRQANNQNQNIRVNACRNGSAFKEVIQPQVPLRLPCYDFTPVINHTVVSAHF